jgi:hypothetical protein
MFGFYCNLLYVLARKKVYPMAALSRHEDPSRGEFDSSRGELLNFAVNKAIRGKIPRSIPVEGNSTSLLPLEKIQPQTRKCCTHKL